MVIRIVAAAVAGFAPLLAGFGTVAQAAPGSDEDQIRQVIIQVAEASDPGVIASLTCAKYLDPQGGSENAAALTDAVPPMSVYPEVVFTVDPDQLARNLATEYTGASPESLRTLADALHRRDEAAYTTAMADVMAQTLTTRVDKVTDIVVTGDTATADATIVASMGGKMSYTDVAKLSLVREGGQWKDCTAPEQ